MPIITLILSLVIMFFGATALGDTRPECADMSHPGACFSPIVDGTGEGFYVCGSPSDGEGLLFWTGYGTQDNDFIRTNLDGSLYAHISDPEVTGVYCSWDTLLSGNCVPGSAEIFVGIVNLQVNGLFDEFGNALCPSEIQTRGEMQRVSDGEPVQILGRLRLVPDEDDFDPPVGCRIQTCSIVAPGRRAGFR
jgi:hypothetical protein